MTKYSGVTRNALVSERKLELARQLRQAATAAETLVWNQLRNRRCLGLKFRRQQVVRGLVVDFYCAEKRLAIELDGEVHVEQVDYDRARDVALAREGMQILRLPNEKAGQVAWLIEESLRSRSSDSPSPVRERGSGGEVGRSKNESGS